MDDAPISTPDGGSPVPAPIEGRCNRPVQECSLCEWRGQNYPGQPCKKCGEDAVIERPCRRAVKDGGPCWSHGGAAPQVRRARQWRRERELAEATVADLLAEVDPGDQHHLEHLAERLRFAASWVRILEMTVATLQLLPSEGAESVVVKDRHGTDRPHVLVSMLGEWSDRHAGLIKQAADHDLDTARLRLEAAEVDLLLGAFTRALTKAGLDDGQQRALQAALAAELDRALPAAVGAA